MKKWHLGRGVKFNALIRVSILVALVGLCTAAFSPPQTEASHFRFGHISWKPLTGTDIEFTITQAWRGTAFSSPPLGGTFSPGGFDFGDNTSTGLTLTVTSLDPVNDWIVGETTITHTYPSPGNFTAFFESCCRINNCEERPNAHINNPSGSERTETIVNVGTGNSSPVSNLPPIVTCPENGVCSFRIPATDPDRDPLTFRLSTSNEAGGFTQPGPPHAPNPASIDPNTGLYTWDTRGATLTPNPASCPNTLYSTQVIIEDGQTKVPLDFLIQLMPVTSMPPKFDSPTPDCGSTLNTNIGSTLTFTVQASDPVPAQTVTLNATGLPVGATMTPALPATGNPVSSTFSWTPAPGQNGSHVINFTIRDDAGSQEERCPLTIIVAGENCSNGIDDDGDSLVDCNDPDCACDPACAPSTETNCANRVDDDCDGLVDCFDPDCGNCLPITRILPNKGGDIGTVTVIIFGRGFVDGATAKLVRAGQQDIVGDPVSVSGDGRTITTIFDCTGKQRGPWDVVVTNPDGTPGIFAEGFTVEEGVAPQVWGDIIGRDTIRVGREQTFHIIYGNRGNVDALGIFLGIAGIPKDALLKVLSDFNFIPLLGETTVPSVDFETDEEKVISLDIPIIPPGFIGVFKIALTIPSAREFQLKIFVVTTRKEG